MDKGKGFRESCKYGWMYREERNLRWVLVLKIKDRVLRRKMWLILLNVLDKLINVRN